MLKSILHPRRAAAVLALSMLSTGAYAQSFADGATVDVLVNWQTCQAQGFTDEGGFYDTVIEAYTRWMHVAGVNLDLKVQGYTTAVNANANQIVVMCNQFHNNTWHTDLNLNGNVDPNEVPLTCAPAAPGCICWDCGRLASTFGSTGGLLIVVHRQSGFTLTNWDFTLYRDTDASQNELYGILMHEFGHAMGLPHGNWDDLMNGGYTNGTTLGPRPDDVAALRAQYSSRDDLRFDVHRSTNGGASWTDQGSNLDDFGVTTTLPASFSRDYWDDQTLLTYSNQDKRPSWIMGNRDGSSFDAGTWFTFGGLPSLYGTGGDGYDDEYMMTWVDMGSADNQVKIVYSSDDGGAWYWRNPPAGTRARGTPAVVKIAADTWVMAYASMPDISASMNWNAAGASEVGRILARVSTNDGASWGPATELNSFYRARNGVSLAADGTGEVRVGFTWDGSSTSTKNRMRTLVGHISGDALVYDRVITDYDFNTFSRSVPSIERPSSRFVRSWREENYDTSINSEYSEPASSSWDDWQRVETTSLVSPAVAADRRSSWTYLYTLQ